MRRLFLYLVIGLVSTGLIVQAQEVDEPTVRVPDGARYMVDADGQSLYIYLNDEEEISNCQDRCAENWPPLMIEGSPTAGQGVDENLLGTIDRDDGSKQVTYNGHPLYYYSRDSGPGQVTGHRLGSVFFLVSPSGEPIRQDVTPVAASPEGTQDAANIPVAQLMSEGQRLFAANCAACHGAQGQGGIGPRLAGYDRLSSPGFVARTILMGRPEHGMPPFGGRFSDREVAAVATFVRNAWSNDFGPVSEEEVRSLR
jgi:predicted lipoprotein with Yx(FWY)xxD motif/mono/diheme cytochrome c family protein